MIPAAPILRDVMPAVTRWRPRETVLTAGMAQVDITPPLGIRAHNWGASRIEVATGVHRPLTATVLALRSAAGGDDAAPGAVTFDGWQGADAQPTGRVESRWRYLISLDLGWWRDEESYLRLARPVLNGLGAQLDDVLMHLVHTHAGPSICDVGMDLAGATAMTEYHDALVSQVITGAWKARAQASEAVITWTYGRCDLAVARNLPCGQRDVVAFEPGVPADDTVAVGRVASRGDDGGSGPGGQILGTIVNYACHPTTLAHENSAISPDYVGALREVVQGATNAPCLFLQGASGELSPREQYVVGPAAADRHGRQLGFAALSALESMGSPGAELVFDGVVESGAPIGLWRESDAAAGAASPLAFLATKVPLAARPARTPEQIAEAWPAIDPVAARERIRRAVRVATGYVNDGVATHPLWVWGLGDAALVAHPGEAFSALQTELRARHPDRIVLVANLTGGPGFVYLPDRESYARDRYQVWQTVLEPGCLEDLIEHADNALAALPAPRKDML